MNHMTCLLIISEVWTIHCSTTAGVLVSVWGDGLDNLIALCKGKFDAEGLWWAPTAIVLRLVNATERIIFMASHGIAWNISSGILLQTLGAMSPSWSGFVFMKRHLKP